MPSTGEREDRHDTGNCSHVRTVVGQVVSEAGTRRYWSPLRGARGKRGATGAGIVEPLGAESVQARSPDTTMAERAGHRAVVEGK